MNGLIHEQVVRASIEERARRAGVAGRVAEARDGARSAGRSRAATAAPRPAAPRRFIVGLVAVAVAVSIVHYIDNTVNFDDYPQPDGGPAPAQAVVAASWFVFTAFAATALAMVRRGRTTAAAIFLGLYAGSGLVGIGHYMVPGATAMPWWRQAHVIADIACGFAVLGVALRLALAPRGSESRRPTAKYPVNRQVHWRG